MTDDEKETLALQREIILKLANTFDREVNPAELHEKSIDHRYTG